MEVFGDTIFYYSEGTKEDASNKELLQAGVGAITGLGSALAQRERRALSEVEQKCMYAQDVLSRMLQVHIKTDNKIRSLTSQHYWQGR